MEFSKDYDFQLMYHPRNANLVSDTLSRKSVQMLALMIEENKLILQFRDLKLKVKFHKDYISCGRLTISNEFFGRIKEKQLGDSNLRHIMDVLGSKKTRDFELGADGLLRFKGRLCIPVDEELKRMILEEGHKSHLNLNLGMTKMYQDLKESFHGQV